MKKYIFLFGVTLTTFILSSTTTKNQTTGEKIMIRHVSPTNNKKVQTIKINVNKLQSHLEHGDTIVKPQ
ncbi:MAG: hypothetical protein ACPGU9_03360 [Flavobacteriaceae bacterium]